MSTTADPLIPAVKAEWRPRFNPWAIAMTVTLATFMEVLDTSIANVALPHIAGNLSISQDEAAWVLTSYLVANAMVLPVSAWLATKFGRKRFYMTCVVLFGVSSLMCGLAPNLPVLVFFRVLQGLGGGGLAPTEQAILADTFAPEKRGQAFSVYAMAVVVAPVIGPTLGGYITDNFSWRWLFLINVPVAVVSLILSSRMLEDPPFLAEMRKKIFKVDYVGLGLIVVGIGALQIVLDKGEREDWFASNFILVLSVVAVVGLITALVWEYHHPHPVFDVRLFQSRNFSVACVMMFMLGAALYGATVLIPQLLQTLMGYTAQEAGMVLSPGGLVIIATMPLIGRLLGKMDGRWLIVFGFASTGIALYHMTSWTLDIDFKTAMMFRLYQAIGMGFLFVPIQTLCYVGIPQEKNNNVSGMTNLARNLGGSIGISAISVIVSRRAQYHQSVLSAHTSQYDATFQQGAAGLTQTFNTLGSDMNHATQMAHQMLYNSMQRQAAMLGYIDAIYVFSVICLIMAPAAFLMQKSKGGVRTRSGH
jgi:DHA2 family multidrug resistance protein